tara:strand:- start:2939 stop:3403 length:465 start_codon:yes stop_codon:yes gene_type:complete
MRKPIPKIKRYVGGQLADEFGDFYLIEAFDGNLYRFNPISGSKSKVLDSGEWWAPAYVDGPPTEEQAKNRAISLKPKIDPGYNQISDTFGVVSVGGKNYQEGSISKLVQEAGVKVQNIDRPATQTAMGIMPSSDETDTLRNFLHEPTDDFMNEE